MSVPWLSIMISSNVYWSVVDYSTNAPKNNGRLGYEPGKGPVLVFFDKDGEWTKLKKKVGGQFCRPVLSLDKDGPKS